MVLLILGGDDPSVIEGQVLTVLLNVNDGGVKSGNIVPEGYQEQILFQHLHPDILDIFNGQEGEFHDPKG